jgi:hypothetical protein
MPLIPLYIDHLAHTSYVIRHTSHVIQPWPVTLEHTHLIEYEEQRSGVHVTAFAIVSFGQ